MIICHIMLNYSMNQEFFSREDMTKIYPKPLNLEKTSLLQTLKKHSCLKLLTLSKNKLLFFLVSVKLISLDM